jgi:hypothetical protein
MAFTAARASSIEVADIEADIHHQKVRATSRAQHRERLIDVFSVRNAGAFFHCKLGCGGELAAERADNEESHGLAPCHSSNGGSSSHQF